MPARAGTRTGPKARAMGMGDGHGIERGRLTGMCAPSPGSTAASPSR